MSATAMASDYLSNAMLDHVTGGTALPQPTQLWVGLYTARGTKQQSCAGTNFVPVVGGGYAEVNIGVGGVNWVAAALRIVKNKLAIAMGTPGIDWTTVIGFTIKDQAANLYWWCDLPVPKPCPAGVPVSFDVQTITFAFPYGT